MKESRLSTLCMTLGTVETNCYPIQNKDGKEALLIDPADDAAQIEKVIRERDLSLRAFLLTHGHFGHVLAVSALRGAFQVLLCAAETEAETLRNPELNGDVRRLRQGLSLKVDRLFHDKEKLSLLGTKIEVLFTPGHTVGSCCHYFPAEKLLSSGDTLSEGPFGRIDLPGGNMASLKRSLDRLLELSADTLVFPGHMGQTSIGEERKSNSIFYYRDRAK